MNEIENNVNCEKDESAVIQSEKNKKISDGDQLFVNVVMSRYVSITKSIIQISIGAIILFITFADNLNKVIKKLASGTLMLLKIGTLGYFAASILGILYMLLSTYMIVSVFVYPTSEIYPQKAKEAFFGKLLLKPKGITWVTTCGIIFFLMSTFFLIGSGSLILFAFHLFP